MSKKKITTWRQAQKETRKQDLPDFIQSITLWTEDGIDKGGVVLAERKGKPALVIPNDRADFALILNDSNKAVYDNIASFGSHSQKKWEEEGRPTEKVNSLKTEDCLKLMANTEGIATFNSSKNVPVTVLPLDNGKSPEYGAFLSVFFPCKEFLAMGSGQPKVVLSRVRESEQRLDEILNTMATWVATRLAARVVAA
jgi:hypothetical protein